MRSSLWSEMKSLRSPGMGALPEPEATLAVSLLIPCRNSAHSLEKTVLEAERFLHERHGESFEIILIPNGSSRDQTPVLAERLAVRHPRVRVAPHQNPPGKGAALRTGFLHSQGREIYFTDADLPYDLEFFARASAQLQAGFDFVSGNRRLPTSQFRIPVSLLRLAYGRHRLGLWFNRAVRALFPIRTTDTQAGIKALSRRLATRAFALQGCPGFFFDIEIILTAIGHSMAITELPVTLYLTSEKSTVRLVREFFLATFWLARIKLRWMKGAYGMPPETGTGSIVSRYRNLSFSSRLFLRARWLLTPYAQMSRHLPPVGSVLDLGCGHGLLALYLALTSPERQVLGIDHDAARIEEGRKAAYNLSHLTLQAGDMLEPPRGPFGAITMIDVLHYFSPEIQARLLANAFSRLKPGGTLIFREVDPQAGIVSQWNRLYEKLATGIGFTRSKSQSLHFRARADWEELARRQGFNVRSERCSSIFFADILFVCERPA